MDDPYPSMLVTEVASTSSVTFFLVNSLILLVLLTLSALISGSEVAFFLLSKMISKRSKKKALVLAPKSFLY